jgi:hypothetical protein
MVLAGISATIESLKINASNSVNNEIVTVIMLFLSVWLFRKYKLSKGPLLDNKNDNIRIAKEKKASQALEKLGAIPGSKARKHLLGATTCITASHMAGLPIVEGAQCFIYLCNDKVIFERNEMNFNLLANKITDVMIKTDTEIQKSHVSSIGGAIGGAVLFGTLGAIIGGRSKEKTSKIESKYLIFSYDKEGITDYISFDVTKEIDAYKFVDYFLKMPKERKEITL